jgi:hypothetical protein
MDYGAALAVVACRLGVKKATDLAASMPVQLVLEV